MKKSEAAKLLNDLMTYYGANKDSYKSAMELYLSEFCKCPASKAKQLFQRIVKTFRFFPKLAELGFIERELHAQAPVTITNSTFCFACKNTGVIFYRKKVQSMGCWWEYAFTSRCPCCEKGKQYPDFPSFLQVCTQLELDDLIEYNRRLLNPTPDELTRAMKTVQDYEWLPV